jgi:hypothetical protein
MQRLMEQLSWTRVIEIAGDAVGVMKADRRPGPFLLPIT